MGKYIKTVDFIARLLYNKIMAQVDKILEISKYSLITFCVVSMILLFGVGNFVIFIGFIIVACNANPELPPNIMRVHCFILFLLFFIYVVCPILIEIFILKVSKNRRLEKKVKNAVKNYDRNIVYLLFFGVITPASWVFCFSLLNITERTNTFFLIASILVNPVTHLILILVIQKFRATVGKYIKMLV